MAVMKWARHMSARWQLASAADLVSGNQVIVLAPNTCKSNFIVFTLLENPPLVGGCHDEVLINNMCDLGPHTQRQSPTREKSGGDMADVGKEWPLLT